MPTNEMAPMATATRLVDGADTRSRYGSAAGDLTAELAEFARMQDMQFNSAAWTETALSYFPTCCS